MSITDRIFDAVKTAILLEGRVSSMAENVAELARDVREIDKRLVRIETLVDVGTRPPAIEDRRK